jgi:hypothetical protein
MRGEHAERVTPVQLRMLAAQWPEVQRPRQPLPGDNRDLKTKETAWAQPKLIGCFPQTALATKGRVANPFLQQDLPESPASDETNGNRRDHW